MSRRKRETRAGGQHREFRAEGVRLLKEAAPLPPDVVRISIPRDHPMAKELLELANLLANRQVLMSGLTVERTPIPDAETRILALLARMGVNTDRIVADLKAGDERRKQMQGGDPVLKAGLGLLDAVSRITGKPDAAAPLADLIVKGLGK